MAEEQHYPSTVQLASVILNPQPPTKPLRSPLIVQFNPGDNGNTMAQDSDLLYARVTIATINGSPFDERRESEMLSGELVCSPPTASEGPVYVFDFSLDGPVFTRAAGGSKIKLKVEVGDYATDTVLAETELPEIKVMKATLKTSEALKNDVLL